jgi:hypothetical protein
MNTPHDPAQAAPEHALQQQGVAVHRAQAAGLDLGGLLGIIQRHGPGAVALVNELLALFRGGQGGQPTADAAPRP